MRKIGCYLCIFILAILIGLHIAPTSFDAGTCSGGYKKYVADKFTPTLVNIFMQSKNFENGTPYELLSTYLDIANSINWKGRIINISFSVKVNNSIYNIYFQGKRYWTEKYHWKILSIETA
jgi:hypothetical protein